MNTIKTIIAICFIFNFMAFSRPNIKLEHSAISKYDSKNVSKICIIILDDTNKQIYNLNGLNILSVNKKYDPNSSTYDPKESIVRIDDGKNWHLNKRDIIHVLRNSDIISATEVDLSYSTLPFWYRGEFSLNGKKGSYEVNAASFAKLRFSDTIIYLGSKLKADYKYFLLHANSE